MYKSIPKINVIHAIISIFPSCSIIEVEYRTYPKGIIGKVATQIFNKKSWL